MATRKKKVPANLRSTAPPMRRDPRENLPLDESLGHNIRLLSRLLMKTLEDRTMPHGVSTGMWFPLRVLWTEDGLSQSDLSERIGVMGPTMVSAVDRMERMGLIERRRSEDDKRKSRVFLTRKGRELFKSLMPVAIGVIDESLEGVNERDFRVFWRVMRQMIANLRAAQEGAPPG